MNKQTGYFKQINIDDGNTGGDGEGQERNYYKKLVEKLSKDIDALLSDVARRVLSYNIKKIVYQEC